MKYVLFPTSLGLFLSLLLVHLTFLSAQANPFSLNPDPQQQRSWQVIEAISFDTPFEPAEIRPPLREGSGNYTRHFSFSIVEFATWCFLTGQRVEEGNEALQRNARHYLENPDDLHDMDSFHWHSEMLCRLIEDFGPNGSLAPGRMTQETVDLTMAMLWEWARVNSKMEVAGSTGIEAMEMFGSENHHLQDVTSAWHFSKLASEDPAYRDRTYNDGSTPAEQYEAWNEYLKHWIRERARRGLFVEIASHNYNLISLKGLYNVYDYAEDPDLRRVTSHLLDLFWANWAQTQIDGVSGAGATRVYQTGNDRRAMPDMRHVAWLFFGIGEAQRRPDSYLLTSHLTDYRVPAPVQALAIDVEGRGEYEVWQYPLGLAVPGYDAQPNYRPRPDSGGIAAYTYVTPDYVMGTLMVEPRPVEDWMRISSQNRWTGVIFASAPDARIVLQPKGRDQRVAVNSYWSVQKKGSLIVQKLSTSVRTGREPMRIWLSEAGGLTERVENGDWIFVQTEGAYAGIRVVRGRIAGVDPSPQRRMPGEFLRCSDPATPVILEVARARDHASFEAFQEAVLDLPVEIDGEVLRYIGLSGHRLTFFMDESDVPRIDDEPVQFTEPEMAFESPFLRGAWNEDLRRLEFGGESQTLDFAF